MRKFEFILHDEKTNDNQVFFIDGEYFESVISRIFEKKFELNYGTGCFYRIVSIRDLSCLFQ